MPVANIHPQVSNWKAPRPNDAPFSWRQAAVPYRFPESARRGSTRTATALTLPDLPSHRSRSPVKPSSPPTNHPVPPPVTPPKKDDTAARKTASAASEQDYYRQVLQDMDPKEPNYDRSYFLVHVYNRMDRPEQVLDAAAPLVQAGVRANYPDPQQVLQILVAGSASFPKLRSPTAQQVATGKQTAHQLLQFLPEYFAASRRPSNVGESAWASARGQLEDVARQALAYHPAPRVGAAH